MRKIALVDLGQHTGLSPALLSKIERGRLFPTLPTLLRIALVFGVGLEYFFAGAREKPLVAVTRKDQRVELPERADARETAYRFASLDYPATERRFNCYHAEFLPVAPAKLRPHEHAGVEFLYVIQGTLNVQIDGGEHVLDARGRDVRRCDESACLSTHWQDAVHCGGGDRVVIRRARCSWSSVDTRRHASILSAAYNAFATTRR